jgi:hypothetical protein
MSLIDNLKRKKHDRRTMPLSISMDVQSKYLRACEFLDLDHNRKAEELFDDFAKTANPRDEIKRIDEEMSELQERKEALTPLINKFEEEKNNQAEDFVKNLFSERGYNKEDSTIEITKTTIAFIIGQLESKYGILLDDAQKLLVKTINENIPSKDQRKNFKAILEVMYGSIKGIR